MLNNICPLFLNAWIEYESKREKETYMLWDAFYVVHVLSSLLSLFGGEAFAYIITGSIDALHDLYWTFGFFW